MTQKAYKYRLYPTKEQEEHLWTNINACRYLYNEYLGILRGAYEKYEVNVFDGLKDVPTEAEMKQKDPWLKEADASSLIYIKRQIASSYRHFFRKLKLGQDAKTRFKSRYSAKQSYTVHNQSIKVDAYCADACINNVRTSLNTRGRRRDITVRDVNDTHDYIKLGKVGWVRFVQHRPLEGRILCGSVSYQGSVWHVSVTCEIEEQQPLPKVNETIGIALGLDTFLVTSEGEKIGCVRFYHDQEKRLQREHKTLSRRLKKGKPRSNRCKKQCAKIAKMYWRITCKRDDFLHKLSHKLLTENKEIIIEDFDITQMIKDSDKERIKIIHDVSWGKFVEMLKYKAKWYGRVVTECEPVSKNKVVRTKEEARQIKSAVAG